ncbi:MAG: V-type ATPase subunit [Clostridia bacterium]|nr:V-type ATPase subunit [Clostridia bacterium]
MKKAKKINELDYVYASTRVKTAEGRGTLRDRLTSFAEASNGEALVTAVLESGLISDVAVKTPADAADAALVGAADLLRSSVPDPDLYGFLFYKYDCNNIKVALKESILGVEDTSRYFTCGTVEPSAVREAVFSRNYSALPENMGKRAKEAQDAYETTKEARTIDLSLDRGCFEDIEESVASSGVPFFKEYASALVDSTNYLSFLRISSSGMAPGACSSLMSRAALPGGTVDVSVFEEASAADTHEERIAALVLKTDSVDYREALSRDGDPDAVAAALEKAVDKVVEKADAKAFGPEVPAVFFIRREAEVRAVRIAASMIASGKTAEAIKARIGIK